MARGTRLVGLLLGPWLFACSAPTPGGPGSAFEEDGIVNGMTDTTHHAVFGIVANDQELCSGSLISPNLLLTARHCVASLTSGDSTVDCNSSGFGNTFAPSAFVVTSDNDITNGVAQSALYGVTQVRVPTDSSLCGNDVALLILDTNIPSGTASPMEPRVDQPPQVNEAYSAVGYGLNDPNDAQGVTAGIRRSLGNQEVGCVGAFQCNGTNAQNDEWAANSPVCSGDSGGPALDSQGRVIGVASRADETCAVALYSSVSSWKDLIVQAATDAANQGGYEPPTWAGGGTPMDGGAPEAGASSGGSSNSGGSSGSGGTSARGGRAATGTGGSGATGGTDAEMGGSGASPGSAGRLGIGGRVGVGGMPGLDNPGGGPPEVGGPGTGELGDACTSSCVNPLRCYTANGKPPGTCVPECLGPNHSCPSGYVCATSLNVCAPQATTEAPAQNGNTNKKSDSGCGCRVTPVGENIASPWQALGIAALGGVFARRRRRAAAR